MHHVDHQRVAAQPGEEGHAGAVGKSGETPLDCKAADACSGKKDENPRQKRELVCGEKVGAVEAQGREPIRGIEHIGERDADGADAEQTAAHLPGT